MQLNALFPTRDIGNDPAKIRDWAQAAEDLGFAYIEVPDHVFGTRARGDWKPRYDDAYRLARPGLSMYAVCGEHRHRCAEPLQMMSH